MTVAQSTQLKFDAAQQRVLDLPYRAGGALLVSGAPGSGRSTLAVELAARRIENAEAPNDVLLLAPTRTAAAQLRSRLSRRLQRTGSQPPVRTAAAVSFAILRSYALATEQPPPVLISGPEQDVILGELLAGHAAGYGATPNWPASIPPEAVALRGFRAELRDLLMRAAERGVAPDQLAQLGRQHQRAEWVAAATVYEEYLDVLQLRWSTPDAGARYDTAVIVAEAAQVLRQWPADTQVPAPKWQTVIVDDHHESTAATMSLLAVMQDSGAQLVLLGDPDAAVQTFRGARPALFAAATGPTGNLGAFGAEALTLPTVWGQRPLTRTVASAVAPIIGVAGAVQQRDAVGAAPNSVGDAVRAVLCSSPASELARIGYELRRAHLVDQLPWEQMAVIVRSGSQLAAVRRALERVGIPVVDTVGDVPLRQEPAVMPLLTAMQLTAPGLELTSEIAIDLLTSPVGSLDTVGLRRLRRALRSEELAGGGRRASDELLVDMLADPARCATLPSAVRRGATRVAKMLAAARTAAAEPSATAETVLWAAWSAVDLARTWQEAAIQGGAIGRQADRDLDAVMALFAAAERFVERMPGAAPDAFARQIRAESLPSDSLANRAVTGSSVSVVTAAGAAGNRWEYVIVAGVQEGVWPDLRLRDSVLGAQALADLLDDRAVDAAADPVAARRAVLHDEARTMFVALTRARSRLTVTAVHSADGELLPSVFFDVVRNCGVVALERDGVEGRIPVNLRDLVAELRAAVVADPSAKVTEPHEPNRTGSNDDLERRRHAAAQLLAQLAVAQVPGADPAQWFGALPLSSSAPLRGVDETVDISPSRVESFVRCPLRWALEKGGGSGPSSLEQSIGTLIHAIAAAAPNGTLDELRAEFANRWPELDSPGGWVAMRRRAEAEKSVSRLADYLATGREVLAVERPFEAQIGRAKLRGTVDRIERQQDGALRIVDLKTGAYADAATIDRNPQLGAYQVAAAAGAFDDLTGGQATEVAGAALVYVGKNKSYKQFEQAPLSADSQPTWAHDLIRDVADGMSAATFEARKNPGCRSCPIKRSCPVHREGEMA